MPFGCLCSKLVARLFMAHKILHYDWQRKNISVASINESCKNNFCCMYLFQILNPMTRVDCSIHWYMVIVSCSCQGRRSCRQRLLQPGEPAQRLHAAAGLRTTCLRHAASLWRHQQETKLAAWTVAGEIGLCAVLRGVWAEVLWNEWRDAIAGLKWAELSNSFTVRSSTWWCNVCERLSIIIYFLFAVKVLGLDVSDLHVHDCISKNVCLFAFIVVILYIHVRECHTCQLVNRTNDVL